MSKVAAAFSASRMAPRSRRTSPSDHDTAKGTLKVGHSRKLPPHAVTPVRPVGEMGYFVEPLRNGIGIA